MWDSFIEISAFLRYRGPDTSGHFIWNLWNKPLASFISFVWNDHGCKILFIIMTLENGILPPSKWTLFHYKTHCWRGCCQWCYVFAPKCYYMCGHTLFMTGCYPLNNSDVIWKKVFYSILSNASKDMINNIQVTNTHAYTRDAQCIHYNNCRIF